MRVATLFFLVIVLATCRSYESVARDQRARDDQKCTSQHGVPCGIDCCVHGAVCCPGKECRMLASDREACGACGKACPDGAACIRGACAVPTCEKPKVNCSGKCVDLRSDDANCGKCDHECPGNSSRSMTCIRGHCEW
jgi:hypothetical protein